MATRKQKQELINTLKFTPIRARLLIQGYGGECYIGSVSREDYEVFKARRVDLDQYLGDWDNELFQDIPEENRFINPGEAYECDDLFHASGATMDDSSWITVSNDETNDDIFSTNLDIAHLEGQGIGAECSEGFESDELDDGTVIFWGGQGEKGCFFDAEFTLTQPFDPKLLKIYYGNGDGWNILTSVEYDGQDLEGQDGYSTTGKWAENKFHIVGDEEVYDSKYRDEDDDDGWDKIAQDHLDDDSDVPVLEGEEMWASEAIDSEAELWEGIPLSPWHAGDVKPTVKGRYQIFEKDASWPFPMWAEWTGRSWTDDGKKVNVKQWRGLSQPVESN
jgi:hypothetical protein